MFLYLMFWREKELSVPPNVFFSRCRLITVRHLVGKRHRFIHLFYINDFISDFWVTVVTIGIGQKTDFDKNSIFSFFCFVFFWISGQICFLWGWFFFPEVTTLATWTSHPYSFSDHLNTLFCLNKLHNVDTSHCTVHLRPSRSWKRIFKVNF